MLIEDELRGWLLDERNLVKLAMIKGIGPKTIDYFKILTGIQICAIDRRLLDFLKQAGIEVSSYDEAKATINLTADTIGIQRAYLGHSIWEYIGKQGPQPCRWRSSKPCSCSRQLIAAAEEPVRLHNE